jgi:hypothetical protein
MRGIAALLASAVLVSCGTTVTAVQTNTPPRQMYPRSPLSVEVFTSALPTRPYMDIGILEAQQSSGLSQDSLPEIINALREKAGELGCDGIVLTDSANWVKAGHLVKGFRATCILYTDSLKPAAPVQPKPAVPAGLTPEMRQQLWQMFETNGANAMSCLANAGYEQSATVGIQVDAQGYLKNWGCMEEHLKDTETCSCMVQTFLESTSFWPTAQGFNYIHVYGGSGM